MMGRRQMSKRSNAIQKDRRRRAKKRPEVSDNADPAVAKMCLQKRAFESYAAAKFFAHQDRMKIYRCPNCDGWHLTSRGRWKDG
jgi:hypothetical protein